HRVDPADLVVVEAEVSGGEPTDLDDVAVVVLRGDHRLALEDLECEGHGHGCCSRRSRRPYSSSTDCITLSRYSSRIRMRLECGTFFSASTYSPSGRERSPSMVSSSKLNSLRFCALAAAASAELVADLSCAAARPGKSATISIHTRMRRPTPEVPPDRGDPPGFNLHRMAEVTPNPDILGSTAHRPHAPTVSPFPSPEWPWRGPRHPSVAAAAASARPPASSPAAPEPWLASWRRRAAPLRDEARAPAHRSGARTLHQRETRIACRARSTSRGSPCTAVGRFPC